MDKRLRVIDSGGDDRGHVPFPHNFPPAGTDCWRKAVVTVTRNEVTYAVDFATAKTGQVMETASEDEKRSQVKNFITGEESKDWLDQQITSAVSELGYSVGSIYSGRRRNAADDKVYPDTEEWDIILKVNENWFGSVDQAARYATDYVTAYVLGRWYSMVDASRVSDYEDRAGKLLAKFRDVVTRCYVGTQFW